MNTHLIKMQSGDLIGDLEIEDVVDGPREKGVLLFEGGIRFRTERRKSFFLKFSEFSFVVNPTPATMARVA